MHWLWPQVHFVRSNPFRRTVHFLIYYSSYKHLHGVKYYSRLSKWYKVKPFMLTLGNRREVPFTVQVHEQQHYWRNNCFVSLTRHHSCMHACMTTTSSSLLTTLSSSAFSTHHHKWGISIQTDRAQIRIMSTLWLYGYKNYFDEKLFWRKII